MNRRPWHRLSAALAAIVGGSLGLAIPSASGGTSGNTPPTTTSPVTAYVALGATSTGAGTSCQTATYSSISTALSAEAAGGKVVVCPGTYPGGLSISKSVDLEGRGANILATGADNAIKVTASSVTISGFVIKGATGEGILAIGNASAPLTKVTIENNAVIGNDVGNPTGGPISNSPYAPCNATPQPAPAPAIPGDCGEGIHLEAVSQSVVAGNLVADNAGGILLTDEVGPTDHNSILGNRVLYNTLDCGVTLASHSSKGYANGTTVPTAGGIFDNEIAHNVLIGNGLIGQGGGVIMATPVPGGAVYSNTVEQNLIADNGLAGVTIHSHLPGQDLNGNIVRGNRIGTNNIDGDFDFSPHVDAVTTGILVASAHDPITTEVSGNLISDNENGIWTTGPVTVTGASDNLFVHVTTPQATG